MFIVTEFAFEDFRTIYRKLRKGYLVKLHQLLIGMAGGRIRCEELHITVATIGLQKYEPYVLFFGNLTEALLDFEFPLVNILADMELWGVGLDMEGCLQARKVLGKKLGQLEKEAYKLAGMKFSDEHPIIPVIKEHRTLAKLLNCTLVSICSLGRLCEDTELVHITWSLAPNINSNWSPLMEEPNRQCVEHMVDFKIYKDGNGNETDVDQLNINARDYFIPTQGRKRFLSKIKLGNSKEKSKAQRSCEFYMSVRYDFFPPFCGDEECGCLKGSAADIIKIAVINIYIPPDSSSHPATKLHVLKGRCRILLQVHDELVLEVDPVVIKEAALLLQRSMENAISLRDRGVPCNLFRATNIKGNSLCILANRCFPWKDAGLHCDL
ncbi:hypothetical protein DVH24_012315 [Malus domestica]|uniref:DNA-directed DNA polymerase family A palm domain-containing protein n=1 Tax=Malus domestica TaxID=3750 RepID=A0A498HU14_MALDO|nr:hypothetical protein DVH24_012315 [Malus domestica]